MSFRVLRLRLDAHRCIQHAALVSRPPPSVASPPSYVHKCIGRPSVDQVCSVRRRRRRAPTTLRPPAAELVRRVEALAVSVETVVRDFFLKSPSLIFSQGNTIRRHL
jgi:hypothetical protein